METTVDVRLNKTREPWPYSWYKSTARNAVRDSDSSITNVQAHRVKHYDDSSYDTVTVVCGVTIEVMCDPPRSSSRIIRKARNKLENADRRITPHDGVGEVVERFAF